MAHFWYFRNIFPFVSMSMQTVDIGTKRPKNNVEQGVDCSPGMN